MNRNTADTGPDPAHDIVRTSSRQARRARVLTNATPYLLLLPGIALVGWLLIWPMSQTVWISLFDAPRHEAEAREFVGLGNYYELLFESSRYMASAKFTALFTFITIVIELIIAFGFALLLDTINRGRSLLVTVAVLPFMVASIAVGLVWRLMYSRDIGIINHFLSWFNVGPVNWLADPDAAMWSAIISEAWATMPFVMLILMAGLTSIPNDVLEAGRADGAGYVKLFWYLKLPLLLPSLTVALVFQMVFKIRVFDLVFILTEGGPGGLTTPVGLLIYLQQFRFFQTGLSAANSVLLLIAGAAIATLYVKLLYREIEY